MFIVDSKTMGYTDIITNVGFLFILWYNWEIRNNINGQPIRFKKVNFSVGISTLVFAGILILSGIHSISNGLNLETFNKGIIVLGVLDIILATAVTLHTILTLRLNYHGR